MTLRNLREKRQWTQEFLAHKAGLTWRGYCRIENGHFLGARFDSICKIADTLGESLDTVRAALYGLPASEASATEAA